MRVVQNEIQNNPILDLNIPLKEATSRHAETPSTGIGKQISIYLLSFFLPPFGLIPAYKYIKQTEFKYKKIGYIAIALTIISLLATVYFAKSTINSFNSQIQKEQQLYNDLGF